MISKKRIDLNLDAGEIPEALIDGSEEALYQIVTSVNIACGGHAGDESSMKKSVELALKYNLNIGAHPSFPDRQNFGREMMQMPPDQLVESLGNQIQSLQNVCREFGTKLTHLKPHGALYNLAAQNIQAAESIITAARISQAELLPIMGLAGSPFIGWIKKAGMSVLEEAFVDRLYEVDGTLRSRKYADALITDPQRAAQQARQIVFNKYVISVTGEKVKMHADTLCIHGDSSQALLIAQSVKNAVDYSE